MHKKVTSTGRACPRNAPQHPPWTPSSSARVTVVTFESWMCQWHFHEHSPHRKDPSTCSVLGRIPASEHNKQPWYKLGIYSLFCTSTICTLLPNVGFLSLSRPISDQFLCSLVLHLFAPTSFCHGRFLLEAPSHKEINYVFVWNCIVFHISLSLAKWPSPPNYSFLFF